MSVRSSASESSLTHPSKWSHSTRRLPGLRERARVGRSCLPAAQRASRGKGSLSALAGRMGPSATGRSAPRRAARPPLPRGGFGHDSSPECVPRRDSSGTSTPGSSPGRVPRRDLGRRLSAPLPDQCLVGVWDADFRLLSRINASSGFLWDADSLSLSHWTPRRGHPIRVWSPTTPLTPSLSPILVGHGAQIRAKSTPVPARDFSRGSLRIGGLPGALVAAVANPRVATRPAGDSSPPPVTGRSGRIKFSPM